MKRQDKAVSCSFGFARRLIGLEQINLDFNFKTTEEAKQITMKDFFSILKKIYLMLFFEMTDRNIGIVVVDDVGGVASVEVEVDVDGHRAWGEVHTISKQTNLEKLRKKVTQRSKNER